MAWVRVDDGFFHHPKPARLGMLRLPAIGLHLLALCWCNANLTDGKIPDAQVRSLAGDLAALLPEGEPEPIIQALIAAKMWRATKAGYVIHDYLKYQPSKAQVLEERRATAIRVQRHRNAKRNAVGNAPVTELYKRPDPVPDPVLPDPTDQASRPSLKDCKARFFAADNTGQQLAALVDAASANGVTFSAQDKARLGALIKKHGHGRPTYEAFTASLGEEGPIDYMTKVLGGQDGGAGAPAHGRRSDAGRGGPRGTGGRHGGEGALEEAHIPPAYGPSEREIDQALAEAREGGALQAAGDGHGDEADGGLSEPL